MTYFKWKTGDPFQVLFQEKEGDEVETIIYGVHTKTGAVFLSKKNKAYCTKCGTEESSKWELGSDGLARAEDGGYPGAITLDIHANHHIPPEVLLVLQALVLSEKPYFEIDY